MCFVSTQPQLDPSRCDGGPQELGHTSSRFVKQPIKSNTVQMLGWETEQEIQMLSFHNLNL